MGVEGQVLQNINYSISIYSIGPFVKIVKGTSGLGAPNEHGLIHYNLISNAIKFTPRNGKVEVKARNINNKMEIAVSDNGIGITNETISKLFRIDANLTTNGAENEKGTGPGLFLCKEFVEKHGGKIWVESESGIGSISKFVLPSGSNPVQ